MNQREHLGLNVLNTLKEDCFVAVDDGLSYISQHTSAYVSIRQHTSVYVSIRQHTSEHVCILSKEDCVVAVDDGL